MTVTIFLGVAFGAGVLGISSAFGVAQSLGELWRRHDGDDAEVSWLHLEEPTAVGLAGAAVARLLAVGGMSEAIDRSSFAQDLAVLGSDAVEFVARAILKLLIATGVGLVVATLPVQTSSGRVAGLVLAAAALSVLMDVQRVQSRAKQRRADILEAVTAFVEFTRLAAHTQSVEGAMRASVRMGASWPFRRLEVIFEQAERHRQPPWRALTALGHRYGMLELVELGGALENAGTEGTRVQSMLAAKATSLRRRMTEDEIERATAATQQLALPLGLLGIVLVGVLLAPALLAF